MSRDTHRCMQAAHVLRQRGYTWIKCSEWFAQRGITYSKFALAMAYMRWRRKNPELPPADMDIDFPLIHHPALADLF